MFINIDYYHYVTKKAESYKSAMAKIVIWQNHLADATSNIKPIYQKIYSYIV